MSDRVTLRLEESMLNRLADYMKKEGYSNRSEAIKNLLDLALNVAEMKEKNPLNLLEEFQKMQLETWIISAQIYLALSNKSDQEKENFEVLSSIVRKSISSKYPDIFAQFESFILRN